MKLAFKLGATALLLVFISTFLPSLAESGSFFYREYSKSIKKEFGINADGLVSIYNKYGSIDVQTWNNNRVKISVTILVEANNEREAQDVFDRINIDFTNSNSFVKAQTQIGNAKRGSSWWGNWSDDDRKDYKVKYEVFVPATNQLDLKMEYGDITAASIENTAKVDVKYGNFQLAGIGDNADINLEYGNGVLEQADDVTGKIRYAQFRCNAAKDIDIDSEYSNITIEQAQDVICNSKYDNYELNNVREFRNVGKYDNLRIGNAENIVVNSQYTEVMANRIVNNATLDLEFGGASIDQIARGFSTVTVNCNYADIKLQVENGASYRMEASADYAGISYPRHLNVTYEKERGISHEVNGYVGTQNARSVIKARLDYGGLKVRQE